MTRLGVSLVSDTGEVILTSTPSDFSIDEMLPSLLDLIQDADISVDESVARQCLSHLLLVFQKNRVMNLTRIVDVHEALVLHIVDSLLLASYVDDAPQGLLLDMGTGAGFPGIPLALATGRETYLLDSVGKKVKAVSGFLDSLGLQPRCHAVHDRVESFALDHRHEFSVVVARAMAALPILIEYAAPLLGPSGQLIVSKGLPSSSEVDDGLYAADVCGLKLVQRFDSELPESLGHRSIFIFQQVSNPTISLPRQIGDAKRKPLSR